MSQILCYLGIKLIIDMMIGKIKIILNNNFTLKISLNKLMKKKINKYKNINNCVKYIKGCEIRLLNHIINLNFIQYF